MRDWMPCNFETTVMQNKLLVLESQILKSDEWLCLNDSYCILILYQTTPILTTLRTRLSKTMRKKQPAFASIFQNIFYLFENNSCYFIRRSSFNHVSLEEKKKNLRQIKCYSKH